MRVRRQETDDALRLMVEHGFSQRRACRLIDVDAKIVRRAPAVDAPEIRWLLRDPGWRTSSGHYRRLGILLARRGWP